jgi:predicted nucleotidyltransferase
MLLPVLDNETLLQEVRRRLMEAIRPQRIVVFGSRARGDARPDSDLDLMVVADIDGSLAERSRVVHTPLIDLDVPIDLVVYTPQEYARFREWRSSVAGIADREGRVLHG